MTLEHTQTGDLLVISNYHSKHIETVRHTTKNQIHVGTWKFRRDGSQIGRGTWSSYKARPATDQDITENERRLLAGDLRRIDYLALSLDQLQRIKKIVDEEIAL
jgi:hypothetical protein